MKRKFNYLAFIICLAIFFAGTSTSTFSKNRVIRTTNDTLKNANLYSAQIAYDDIHRFDTLSSSIYYRVDIDTLTTVYRRVDPIKAFTISRGDLLAALGMPPTLLDKFSFEPDAPNYIRAYLGLDTPGNKFKLFLVPVSDYIDSLDEGEDMLLDIDKKITPPAPGCKNWACLKDLYVLDLNTPCPNYCNFGTPFHVLGTRSPKKRN